MSGPYDFNHTTPWTPALPQDLREGVQAGKAGPEKRRNLVINLKKSRKHAEFAAPDGPSW